MVRKFIIGIAIFCNRDSIGSWKTPSIIMNPFHKLVANAGLVEPTGQQSHATRGRPAALFRFRREVLQERPAPGLGLPKAIREG